MRLINEHSLLITRKAVPFQCLQCSIQIARIGRNKKLIWIALAFAWANPVKWYSFQGNHTCSNLLLGFCWSGLFQNKLKEGVALMKCKQNSVWRHRPAACIFIALFHYKQNNLITLWKQVEKIWKSNQMYIFMFYTSFINNFIAKNSSSLKKLQF